MVAPVAALVLASVAVSFPSGPQSRLVAAIVSPTDSLLLTLSAGRGSRRDRPGEDRNHARHGGHGLVTT